uniref:START domain-containing protein n=1 Tax=Steinernema glaseri TaxID=37863 RepID=A0A1I7Y485_9BILA
MDQDNSVETIEIAMIPTVPSERQGGNRRHRELCGHVWLVLKRSWTLNSFCSSGDGRMMNKKCYMALTRDKVDLGPTFQNFYRNYGLADLQKICHTQMVNYYSAVLKQVPASRASEVGYEITPENIGKYISVDLPVKEQAVVFPGRKNGLIKMDVIYAMKDDVYDWDVAYLHHHRVPDKSKFGLLCEYGYVVYPILEQYFNPKRSYGF